MSYLILAVAQPQNPLPGAVVSSMHTDGTPEACDQYGEGGDLAFS